MNLGMLRDLLGRLFGGGVTAKIQELIFQLKDSDPSVRDSAVHQMIALGPPAVDPLIEYLRHPDKWARLMAAAALGKMRQPRAIRPLEQVLSDPDEGVRDMAQVALNELRQEQQRAEWIARQPTCTVCHRTSSQVESAKRASGQIPIGLLVGICPQCRKGFCVDHAPYDASIMVDSIVCPTHRCELDLSWSGPTTAEKPWRIGPAPDKL